MQESLDRYDWVEQSASDAIFQLNNKEEALIHDLEVFTGVKYSDEQLKILRHKGGMCVLASAGSGKTTTITHLIAKRIKSGEIKNINKVLCTTYSKAGADEMCLRLTNLLNQLGIKESLTIKTMHAVYLSLLKQMGYACNVIDGKTRTRFIIEACKENKVTLEGDDLQVIDSLLSYQINNLITDDQLCSSYVFTLNISKESYTAIRKEFAKKKAEKGLIDFDDMQVMVYNILRNSAYSALREWVRSLWDDFFIDEVQDISKIQYEILKFMVPDGANLVFIGDDDQCVYQWRGADPSIILNIPTFFKIKKFNLSTNYRCKANIVDRAAVGIRNNTVREEKPIRAFAPGGVIRFCDCNCMDLYTMSRSAYIYIKNLIDSGVKPSEIAVLSRNNQQLAILGNMLFFGGYNYKATNEMKITNTMVFRDLKTLLNIVNGSFSHLETESILWKICPYLRKVEANHIASFQKDAGLSFYDTLGYSLKVLLGIQGVNWNNPNIKVQKLVEEKQRKAVYCLRMEPKDKLAEILAVLSGTDTINKLTYLIASYQENMAFMFKSPESERILRSICKYFIKLAKTYGTDKLTTLIKQTEIAERAEVLQLGDKITLSTMHGAKGKEWRYVVIFADDNVAFPSFYDIRKMALNNVSQGDIWNSLNENRRLHYVALTRAKDEVLILTDKNNMSVFTCEAFGLIGKEGESISNNTIIRMVDMGGLYGSVKESIEELFKREEVFIPGE